MVRNHHAELMCCSCAAPAICQRTGTDLRSLIAMKAGCESAACLLAFTDGNRVAATSPSKTLATYARRRCRSHGRQHMGLRDKYAYAVQTAKNLRMQGSADERGGKLYFHGTVASQEDANKIWDAIKTIPDWPTEIVADIK